MTCRADITHHLSFFNMLTHRHNDVVGMTVKCPVAVTVVDNAVSAVTAAAAAAVILAEVVRAVIIDTYDSTCISRNDLSIVDVAVPDVYAVVIAHQNAPVSVSEA